MLDSDQPIFVQIAQHISAQILAGAYAEETQVPSTNEFAAYYRINPATAGKGVNLLVDRGILYKKRGIGMFVATGARDILARERKAQFMDSFITPLVAEARSLGLTLDEVNAAIAGAFSQESGA